MSKVVCPYCFEKFENTEVEFRCSNPGCKKEKDEKLSKFWEPRTQITGKAIKSSGGFLGLKFSVPESAKCADCGRESYLMICPKCHNRIPKEMVKNKGYIISIIGAKSSGKTNYITTLINELFRQGRFLGNIGTIAANVAEKPEYNTQQRYEKDFFDTLYRKGKCPESTDVIDERNKIPLIYELRQKKGKSIYLVFYDTAGENFNDPNNIGPNVKFLNESDAVIFLFDTFAIPYVHDKLGIKTPIDLPYNGIIANVLSYFTNFTSTEISNAHFSKPMALVFSKIDAVLSNEEQFADTSFSDLSMENNSSFISGNGVSLSEFQSISDSLKTVLSEWNETNFVDTISNTYKNAKFFGISSLGGQPDSSNNIKKVKPYRVLDPLVWILSELKFPLPINK